MIKLSPLPIACPFIYTRHVLSAFLLLITALIVAPFAASAVTVGQLRCEYLKDPLGIDMPQPRLSWVLDADKGAARGQAQSGYQILVARNRNELEANQGDLWDSGQVNSDQSIQVRYAGKALVSEQECFWKVRVWDEQGKPFGLERAGALDDGTAQARPIGTRNGSGWTSPLGARSAKKVLGDAQWIWFPEGQPEKAAPVGTRYFRRVITLPADRTVKRATSVLHRRR